MHICISEDKNFSNFEPLMFSRPVYDFSISIETPKSMTSRCNVEFIPDGDNLFCETFKLTQYDIDKKGF